MKRVPLLLMAALFLLAGCVRPGGRVGQGNRDQIFYWGNGTEPADLDPQTSVGEPDSHILNAVFEGLVSQDPKDLHPIPGVAETWDMSPDGRTYTFHLRHNARWSNGDPLTSRDFLESYRRILSPALGSQYAEMLYKDAEVVNARAYFEGKVTDFAQVGFRAPDPYTLVVQLANPADYFLALLNHQSWYPVHLPTILKYGKFDEKSTRWTRPGNLVGNGPFNLKAWRTEQDVVVEKSPTYWDAAAVRLKEIHFFPTENLDAEERDFRAGQLHVTYEVPHTKIDGYRERFPQVYRNAPYIATYFYRFNVTDPVMKDRRIRRALSLAIDREGIAKNVVRGGQQPAYFLTPPASNGYTCQSGIPTDYDAARRLLAEAGYPGGAGLPTVKLLINTSQSHRAIAEVMQQTWKKELGIDAAISNEEFKVYLNSQHSLNYMVSRSTWIGDYADAFTFLGLFVSGGGNNDTGWANSQYDDFIARSRSAPDPATRKDLLQQAEALLLDEAVVAPIYFLSRVYLLQPSVKGWYDNIQDRHMPKFIYLEDTAPVNFKPDGQRVAAARK